MLDDNEIPDQTVLAAGSKEERIERERLELLARVGSSETSTLRQRVAWIMNRFPITRNSDIALQVKYWEIFHADKFNGKSVQIEDLYTLTRLTSIARERARIQNQYRLFLADPATGTTRDT